MCGSVEIEWAGYDKSKPKSFPHSWDSINLIGGLAGCFHSLLAMRSNLEIPLTFESSHSLKGSRFLEVEEPASGCRTLLDV